MSGATHEEPLPFERIVFFSDAVFAIAITLLVLEIKVPHIPHAASTDETILALAPLIPKVIGYLVSFVVLGTFWIEHHRIFRHITRFDAGLLWRNLAMLLTVAFVPFPTALFSENYTNALALCVYALTLGAVGLSKIWVWGYAAKGLRLLPATIPPGVVRNISWRSWAVPITALTVAVLAAFGARLAYIGFAFLPLVAWLLGRGAARGAAAALLVAALLPDPAAAQAIDTALALKYRVAAVSSRRIQPEAYWAAITPSLRSGVTVDSIGTSSLGRPLRSIRFGSGPTTVLLWSQMHGDEATATLALADILRYLAEAPNDALRQRLERSLTIVMIPMLNPDGAARWQRENAGGIDINRDGRRLSTPEARALKGTHDRYRPAFGFNLHDQSARVRAGQAGTQVAIALLPPAFNEAGAYDSVRSRARKLTSVIATRLAQEIPGRIAKYDDSYNARAFGDLIQSWGTSTILIESGALPNDPDKQRLRALNFIGILTALDAIATGAVDRADPQVYDALPYNTSGAYDRIIRGAKIVIPGQLPFLADVATNFDDAVARSGPRLREVGDLQDAIAMDTVDASGLFIHPRATMLTTTNRASYLRLGAPLEFDLRRGPEPTSPVVR